MSTGGVPEGPGPPERPPINHDDDMITESLEPESQKSNITPTKHQHVDLATNETNSQQQQSEINPSIKVKISINKYSRTDPGQFIVFVENTINNKEKLHPIKVGRLIFKDLPRYKLHIKNISIVN